MRRDDGQILPGLMILLLAIIGLGIMAFGIGRAALLRSDAQTAADAAALAGARNVRDQLEAQMVSRGYTNLGEVNRSLVEAAAADYARRNGARLARPIALEGADVRVWVDTKGKIGDVGESTGTDESRGEARARGRIALSAAPGAGFAGLGTGSAGAGPQPLDCPEKDLEIDTEGGARGIVEDAARIVRCVGGTSVYVCSDFRPSSTTTSGNPSDHGSNNSLQAARDIAVREANCLSGPSSPKLNAGVVAIGKALGRNYGTGAQRIVDTFGWKDYRVQIIWYTPEYGDHRGHIHIGVRKGGVVSGGGTGGAGGAFDITQISVKLVDWEAPAATLASFNAAGDPGGIPFGPPDPRVAAKLCKVLDDLDAPPKARLALWEAAIVESGVKDLPDGHDTSVGVLQLLDIHLGGSVSARRDVELVARIFLTRGFTSPRPGNGAIGVARRNEGMSAGQVAQDVQGSAHPERYDQRKEQAIALNEKFCGGKGLS